MRYLRIVWNIVVGTVFAWVLGVVIEHFGEALISQYKFVLSTIAMVSGLIASIVAVTVLGIWGQSKPAPEAKTMLPPPPVKKTEPVKSEMVKIEPVKAEPAKPESAGSAPASESKADSAIPTLDSAPAAQPGPVASVEPPKEPQA